jgi:hypothetical protein
LFAVSEFPLKIAIGGWEQIPVRLTVDLLTLQSSNEHTQLESLKLYYLLVVIAGISLDAIA